MKIWKNNPKNINNKLAVYNVSLLNDKITVATMKLTTIIVYKSADRTYQKRDDLGSAQHVGQ